MRHVSRQLKKELRTHTLDYLLLFTAGVFFIVSLNMFKGDRFMEFILLIAFSCFYIIWGIYHHIIEDSLHLKIVLEYILIAFTFIFLLKIVIFP